MWLKIVYNEDDMANWQKVKQKISVSFESSITVNSDFEGHDGFRVSPIFPLLAENIHVPDLAHNTIRFYNFRNAYHVLGSVTTTGSEELKGALYFSLGLSSVILVTNEEAIVNELHQCTQQEAAASETWFVIDNRIDAIECEPSSSGVAMPQVEFPDYSCLPVTERAIVDEFIISVKFLLAKLIVHVPQDLPKVMALISEVRELVNELIYLCDPKDNVPANLDEFTVEDLKKPGVAKVIWYQNIDRIVQIDSALSYVSTQAFSGVIPILERRSIIRRHSLLGIGTAILALNRITNFIDSCLSRVPFDEIITESLAKADALPDANLPKYDSKNWKKRGVNVYHAGEPTNNATKKLPYFSGRLGFRETECAITAAMESITSGAGLEWSLMTITHEMLHGHFRDLVASIFRGDEKMNEEQQREIFTTIFNNRIQKHIPEESAIDSIRNIIFYYCIASKTFGSISKAKPYTSKADISPLNKEALWAALRKEQRNISEIFVHVLDLHYFYGGDVNTYIPLIWCSWLSVPHVAGDIRQYTLRSLLAIASSIKGDVLPRFIESATILKNTLESHSKGKLQNATISKVLDSIAEYERLQEMYFPAFKVSLIIVDLATEIFLSDKVSDALWDDDLVEIVESDSKEATGPGFVYKLPEGFNMEPIAAPLTYLLHSMNCRLSGTYKLDDLERETVIQYLALSTN